MITRLETGGLSIIAVPDVILLKDFTGSEDITLNRYDKIILKGALVKSGTPSLKIGTTLHGDELMLDTPIPGPDTDLGFTYYADSAPITLYFESTAGNLTLRVERYKNYYQE